VPGWFNWMLVIGGAAAILAELVLGVESGFDLVLLGVCVAAGGGLGLVFASPAAGLFSAGALALIYLAFLRRAVRLKMTVKDQPSNVDAIVSRTGVVVVRIAPHSAGQVKVGDEIWRAELLAADQAAKEVGQTVTVEAVEGVTIKVR
jgi:membrane protein implicated in regulation of membrane protease activity